MSPRTLRVAVVAGSVSLWLLALALPAVLVKHAGGALDAYSGWRCLVSGAFAIFLGVPAWFGNLSLFAAWVLLLAGFPRVSLTLAVTSLALGATSFMLEGRNIPINEGGVNDDIGRGVGLGFVVWMSSMLVLAIGTFVVRLPERARR